MPDADTRTLTVTHALQQLLWSQIESYAHEQPALAAIQSATAGESVPLSTEDADYLRALLTEVAIDPLSKYDGITPGEVRCAKAVIRQLAAASPPTARTPSMDC